MNKSNLTKVFRKCFDSISIIELNIFKEKYDVIRVEIVSDEFIGVNLTSRLDRVINLTLGLETKRQFRDSHFIYNTLTYNEKYKRISETVYS